MVQLTDRTLPGAPERYRSERATRLHAETELREGTERVAAMRRALPPGPLVRPYALREGPANLAADVAPAWSTAAGVRVTTGSPSTCRTCSAATTRSSSTT